MSPQTTSPARTSTRRGRRARLGLALAALGCAALLASGCVGLKSVSASQPRQIGDVRVAARICPSESPGCAGRGNSDTEAKDGTVGQILLGYRIPAQAVPRVAPVAAGLTFRESPGYAAELQRLVPAAAGYRWVGYISDTAVYSEALQRKGVPVRADFAPPVTPGIPYPGPFRYRPVVGARTVTAAAPASRPVVCGGTPGTMQSDGDAVVVCVDGPSAARMRTNASRTTQDLTVVAGAERVPGRAGSVVAVPFTLRHAGRGPALQVTLSATSSLKGAAVAPSPATLVPTAGGEHQVLVVVGIPAGARPAIQGVTLRASLPGGEVREMTTRLYVREAIDSPAVARRKSRPVRLDWPRDRRAAFYNLQVFTRSRKVLSLFPRADQRLLRLRPGRYRVVVWSGLGPVRGGRYAPRAWVNRMVTVAPARTASARARTTLVRLRR